MMTILASVLFGVSTNILLTIAAVLFVVFVLVISRIVSNKLENKPQKWFYIIGYIIKFAVVIGAIGFILWLWNYDYEVYFTELFANVTTTLEDSLVKIVSSVLVIFITLFVLKISKVSINNVGKKPGSVYRRRRTLAKLTLSIINYLSWIIAIIIVLAIWGVNIGPALAGLGILGLVIGLGAQKFINDLISGLFIIFEQHYDVGDIIESNGFKGEVIDIGLKTTRIKNWKGEVKILANGSVSDVINYSKNPSLAIVDFGIAYAEDVEKTTTILKKELPKFSSSYPEIIEEPEILGVIELAGSSVNIRVIARTLTNQHFNIERQLRAFIKTVLDKHKIEIPFPQVVVHEAKDQKKKAASPKPKTAKATLQTKAQSTTTPKKQVPKKKVASSPKPKTPSKKLSPNKK